MIKKQLKFFSFIFIMGLVSEIAWAKKLDWSTGYFKLVAKTPTASGTIDSFSAFQLSYRAVLMSRVELSLVTLLTFQNTCLEIWAMVPI